MIPILANPQLEQFRALEQQTLDLAVANRTEELIAFLDDRFTAISFHGITYTREQFADTLYRGTTYHRAVLGEIEVIHEGSFAVVTGTVELDWERNGLRMTGPVRFTRVWNRRPQGWKVLRMHASDARLSSAWSTAMSKAKS